MALFSDAGIQFLFRWIHFLSGITWIGLLYYFNFVQGPFFVEADASTKSVATQKLVPRALWWFRWAAMLTFLSGLAILALRRASWSDPWGMTILSGSAFGTLMFLNVWLVIWPNQKIVIANAVATAGGGQANPVAAGAARRAFLASRTNVVFSFPMLFFMGAASHFPLNAMGNRGMWGVLLLAILALLEINALVGTAGPTKKPIETVRGVIVTGFVTAAVVCLIAGAVLAAPAA
ncbi:MAG: urate hydroxylase PuuD [Gemmatimonadales bacterium]